MAADELDGLSLASCCTACGPAGCVITGDICAHPARSGGLQSTHQMRPDVLARFSRAKVIIEHERVERDAARRPGLTGSPFVIG